MAERQTVRELRVEIAKLYTERSKLMAELLQNRSLARGFGDSRTLDEKIREYLMFEIAHLIAKWDREKVQVADFEPGGGVPSMLSDIVDLEERISALEDELPDD
jgi:hypothetical protein